MVQVLATIFFSAASLTALGVIVATIGDNFGDVRTALGLSAGLPPLPSARVRLRRLEDVRVLAAAGLPLRAAA